MNQRVQWKSLPPAGLGEIRRLFEAGHVPQAEQRDDLDGARDPQQALERVMVENADPPHPDAFRPGRQPEILNCATRAVQVGVEDRRATQDVRPAAPAGARDAEAERRLLDPFELQAPIELPPRAPVPLGRFRVGSREERLDGGTRLRATDDDEIPGLHEADGSRVVGRVEHPPQDGIRDRRREEVPSDIPALEDGAVDGGALVPGKFSVHHRRPHSLTWSPTSSGTSKFTRTPP